MLSSLIKGLMPLFMGLLAIPMDMRVVMVHLGTPVFQLRVENELLDFLLSKFAIENS